MAQPANWLWGLVPLALLWSAGNLYLDDAVQDDVSRRAIAVATQAAGEAPGARPVMALVAGRDVLIGPAVCASSATSDRFSDPSRKPRGNPGLFSFGYRGLGSFTHLTRVV